MGEGIRLSPDEREYIRGEKRYTRISDIAEMTGKPGLDAWRERVGVEEADRIAGEAAEYGELVHEITMLNDQRKMKEVEKMLKKRPFLVAPWVAWFDWVDKFVVRILAIEEVVWSDRWMCAGRVDRVLLLKQDKEWSLWDLKTGGLFESVGIQLGGYVTVWNEKHKGKERVRRFGAISLPRKNPGDLRVKEYTDVKHIKRFKELAIPK